LRKKERENEGETQRQGVFIHTSYLVVETAITQMNSPLKAWMSYRCERIEKGERAVESNLKFFYIWKEEIETTERKRPTNKRES